MNPEKLRSAVDVVGPAFDRTKAVLFSPFQWHRWWRIALIGMGTAVIGTANGCNLGGLNDFQRAIARDPKAAEDLAKLYQYISPAQVAAFITFLIASAVLLALVHIYVNSVARFMMFDAMTEGQVRIRQGWSKWHGHGLRLLGFQMLLAAFVTAILSFMGYFFSLSQGKAETDPGAFLVGFFAMMGATWIFSIIVLCFHQLSMDFAVPVMALEDAPLLVALRRVWAMVAANVLDFIVYLIIKAVLFLVMSMVLFMAYAIILIIPVVIIIVIMVMAAKGLAASPLLLVMFLGLAAFLLAAVVLFLVAMISAPVYVFFQGYALEFFADRYPRLKAILYPAAPPHVEPPPLPAM